MKLTKALSSASSTQAVLRTYAAQRENADGMNRTATLKRLGLLLRRAPRSLWRTVHADQDFSRLVADCRKDYHSSRLQALPPQVAAGYIHGLHSVKQLSFDDILACCAALELHATGEAETKLPDTTSKRHSFDQASGNETARAKAFEFHAHKISGAMSAASAWFGSLSPEARSSAPAQEALQALRQTLAATAAHIDGAVDTPVSPGHAAVLLWASARLGVGLPLVQSAFAEAAIGARANLSAAHMTMTLCAAADITAAGHDVPLAAVHDLQGAEGGVGGAESSMCQAWVRSLLPAAAAASSSYTLLDLTRTCWSVLVVQPSLAGGLAEPFDALAREAAAKASEALQQWGPAHPQQDGRLPVLQRTALHAVCDLAGAVARFGGFAPGSREASVSPEAEAWATAAAPAVAALLGAAKPLARAIVAGQFSLRDMPQDRSVRARATAVMRHLKTRQVAALLKGQHEGEPRDEWHRQPGGADPVTTVPSAFADVLS